LVGWLVGWLVLAMSIEQGNNVYTLIALLDHHNNKRGRKTKILIEFNLN